MIFVCKYCGSTDCDHPEEDFEDEEVIEDVCDECLITEETFSCPDFSFGLTEFVTYFDFEIEEAVCS